MSEESLVMSMVRIRVMISLRDVSSSVVGSVLVSIVSMGVLNCVE